MRRRHVLAASLLAVLAPRADAQADWRRVAVPFYGARDFVQGHLRGHALPRARAWQRACEALVDALERPQARDAARAAWKTAVLAWAGVSSVATGPLVARRSVRRIDFQPPRIPLVQRAIAAVPVGEAAMERIGSAAKGFGALEWLLFAPQAPREAAADAYALEVAREIAREATAVADAFAADAERELDDEEVAARFAEVLNQWIGGLEQLRMQRFLRPLGEARAGGAAAASGYRPWAHVDADERAERWQALQALAAFSGAAAPAPGSGALLSLETYLRGSGANPLADRLRRATLAAGEAVGGAASGRPAALQRAAGAIARLRQLAEAEVAPALKVRLGFSDADGD